MTPLSQLITHNFFILVPNHSSTAAVAFFDRWHSAFILIFPWHHDRQQAQHARYSHFHYLRKLSLHPHPSFFDHSQQLSSLGRELLTYRQQTHCG